MRSSEGLYNERLDHLRALAVVLVFAWHFVHGGAGVPLLPFTFAPPDWAFPLSMLEEGHSGVALFMVLSGYLFTTIVGTRTLLVSRFLLNRALRLFPVLALVLLPYALAGALTVSSLLGGFVHGWPADGSWSIAVEIQFYLLLPVLLAVPSRGRVAAWCALLLGMLALRCALHLRTGDIKELVTFTIVGRADNFLVGMVLAELSPGWRRSATAGRTAALAFLSFLIAYHAFNRLGGGELAGSSALWIVLPTLESLGCAALILLYDRPGLSPSPLLGRLLSSIGSASYAIYLLHFGIVIASLKLVAAAGLAAEPHPGLVALLAVPVFAACFAVGWLVHVFIERPVLALRVPYSRTAPTARPGRADGLAAAPSGS